MTVNWQGWYEGFILVFTRFMKIQNNHQRNLFNQWAVVQIQPKIDCKEQDKQVSLFVITFPSRAMIHLLDQSMTSFIESCVRWSVIFLYSALVTFGNNTLPVFISLWVCDSIHSYTSIKGFLIHGYRNVSVSIPMAISCHDFNPFYRYNLCGVYT